MCVCVSGGCCGRGSSTTAEDTTTPFLPDPAHLLSPPCSGCAPGTACVGPGECGCADTCVYGDCFHGACRCWAGYGGAGCDLDEVAAAAAGRPAVPRLNRGSGAGVNLAGPAPWSTEWVWTDLMKGSSGWMTANTPDTCVGGGGNGGGGTSSSSSGRRGGEKVTGGGGKGASGGDGMGKKATGQGDPMSLVWGSESRVKSATWLSRPCHLPLPACPRRGCAQGCREPL